VLFKNKKIISASIPVIFGMYCFLLPLHSKAEYCDDFSDSVCASQSEEKLLYKIEVLESRKGSWYDLGYYMYFHTRQTPGIRVSFSRPLNNEEFQIFEKTIQCNYRLFKKNEEVSGHLEGLHVDEDRSGFWCFDYLGTMLVKFHKKYGTIQEKPEESFFPVNLELSYKSSLEEIQGKNITEIQVKWQ